MGLGDNPSPQGSHVFSEGFCEGIEVVKESATLFTYSPDHEIGAMWLNIGRVTCPEVSKKPEDFLAPGIGITKLAAGSAVGVLAIQQTYHYG